MKAKALLALGLMSLGLVACAGEEKDSTTTPSTQQTDDNIHMEEEFMDFELELYDQEPYELPISPSMSDKEKINVFDGFLLSLSKNEVSYMVGYPGKDGYSIPGVGFIGHVYRSDKTRDKIVFIADGEIFKTETINGTTTNTFKDVVNKNPFKEILDTMKATEVSKDIKYVSSLGYTYTVKTSTNKDFLAVKVNEDRFELSYTNNDGKLFRIEGLFDTSKEEINKVILQFNQQKDFKKVN